MMADVNIAAWLLGAAEMAEAIPPVLARTTTGPAMPLGAPPSSPPLFHLMEHVPPGTTKITNPGIYEWRGYEVFMPVISKAIDDLDSRRLVTRPEYDSMDRAARAKAFTVAHLSTQDALWKVRDAIRTAVAEGTPFTKFKDSMAENVETSKLGIGHLETVFRTATGQLYANGKERMVANPVLANIFAFVENQPIRDSRLSDLCRIISKSGISGSAIYMVADPVWQKFKCPRHPNCRCNARYISWAEAADRGIWIAQEYIRTGIFPAVLAFVPIPRDDSGAILQLPKGWTAGGGYDF